MRQYTNVLIVDGLNAFIRSYSVDQSLTIDGEKCGGTVGFLNCLKSWINKLNPDSVFICWDGANGSIRRRSIFKEYKQNRKPFLSRGKTDDDSKNKLWQLQTLVETLKFFPICQIYIDNCEADDVIYYLVNKLKDSKKIIVSSDKDFYQLVDDNTTIYTLSKKIVLNKKAIKDDTGVWPVNFALYRSFIGDKSDNIEGVKGIGPKRVAKLFPFITEDKKYEMSDITNFINENQESKSYVRFNDEISKLERNFNLIKLDYNFLSLSQISQIDNTISTFKPKLSILDIRKKLIKAKISIPYIDSVITPFRSIQ